MTTLQALFERRIAIASQKDPRYAQFADAGLELITTGKVARTPREARQCAYLGKGTGRMIELTSYG